MIIDSSSSASGHLDHIWLDPYFTSRNRTKLLIALVIAHFTAAGEIPSIEEIAKKALTSLPYAKKAIQELQKDGKLAADTFTSL